MSRFRKFFLSGDEIFLVALSILATAFMAIRVQHLGIGLALTDQSAHLNFARLLFDSITPGISQIGFWPPLLQIILAPFVAINSLYRSGLAAYFALVPFVCAASVSLYRIAKNLTNSRILGLVATLLLLMNPYFLYFSVTPMMEVLFISNLVILAYVLLRWIETTRLSYLILTGVFVTLASLSRFEGLILLPLVALIVFLNLYRTRQDRSKTEATVLLFGLVGIIGIAFILVYSAAFSSSGSPLTFLGGSWIHDPAANLSITRGNLITTTMYLVQAAYFELGRAMVVTALISVAFLLFARKNRFATVAVLVTLASPIVFIMLSLFSGSSVILVPTLFPYHFFHNERYSITFVALTALAPVLLIGAMINAQIAKRWLKSLVIGFSTFALSLLLGYSAYRLYQVSFVVNFPTITNNINVPNAGQHAVATYLANNYDYGKILITRTDNDPTIHDANLPLNDYVYEANDRYDQQVLAEPWMFTRWVVMNNPNNPIPNGNEIEPVQQRQYSNPEFHQYYTLVAETNTRLVYKLNEEAVLQLAIARKYDPARIPSLNANNKLWSPSTVYADAQYSANTPQSTSIRSKRLELKKSLLTFYGDRLRPEYQKGFAVDSSNKGSSETQSYALLQAYYADDQATFDNVWKWTQKNLQRSDGLFSWQYKLNPDYTITITDANGATDADSDIAYALLMGSKKWGNVSYEKDAQSVINGIWNKETAVENNRRHLIAGNWATTDVEGLVINPSYFSPTAIRAFAAEDTAHDWNGLISQSYTDITTVSEGQYAHRQWAFLPPNWAVISPKDGTFKAYTKKSDSIDYSYDAFRTLYRIAQDYNLTKNSQAKAYLDKVTVFQQEWEKSGSICSLYLFSKQGTPCYQETSTMAGTLATASVTNRELAQQVLDKYYVPNNTVSLPNDAAFYAKSWYWFGLYAWSDQVLTIK